MARLIQHGTEAGALLRCEAISTADGLPRSPTHRGAHCPPAPFGDIVRSHTPIKRPGFSEWYTPERLDVDGQEVMAQGSPYTITNTGAAEVDTGAWDPPDPADP